MCFGSLVILVLGGIDRGIRQQQQECSGLLTSSHTHTPCTHDSLSGINKESAYTVYNFKYFIHLVKTFSYTINHSLQIFSVFIASGNVQPFICNLNTPALRLILNCSYMYMIFAHASQVSFDALKVK